MNYKSLFLGIVIVITIALTLHNLKTFHNNNSKDDESIQYLEQPVNYENKKETSFKVFQVLGNAALADEISNKEYKWYRGKTALILGENFYCDQIVHLKNPQLVGTYNYTTVGGTDMTVPVLEGEINE